MHGLSVFRRTALSQEQATGMKLMKKQNTGYEALLSSEQQRGHRGSGMKGPGDMGLSVTRLGLEPRRWRRLWVGDRPCARACGRDQVAIIVSFSMTAFLIPVHSLLLTRLDPRPV
jgi:hypothetical protein